MPNKSPEPMRVGAGSSASRLDVVWSRMAQLFSLGCLHVFMTSIEAIAKIGELLTRLVKLLEGQRDKPAYPADTRAPAFGS